MCSTVKFNVEAVKELVDWVGGVAAEVAEDFGLNGYAKRVVFGEFVTSWILVSAHSGSGLREHVRRFSAAGRPFSSSSISHRLNRWPQLCPALSKVFGRVVKRVKKRARNSFLPQSPAASSGSWRSSTRAGSPSPPSWSPGLSREAAERNTEPSLSCSSEWSWTLTEREPWNAWR